MVELRRLLAPTLVLLGALFTAPLASASWRELPQPPGSDRSSAPQLVVTPGGAALLVDSSRRPATAYPLDGGEVGAPRAIGTGLPVGFRVLPQGRDGIVGTGVDARGRLLSAAGPVTGDLGAPVMIGRVLHGLVAVATDERGEVAWAFLGGAGLDVVIQRAGSAHRRTVRVARPAGTTTAVDVAVDRAGGIVVVWVSGRRASARIVRARFVRRDGALRKTQALATVAEPANFPASLSLALTMRAPGRAVVAYCGQGPHDDFGLGRVAVSASSRGRFHRAKILARNLAVDDFYGCPPVEAATEPSGRPLVAYLGAHDITVVPVASSGRVQAAIASVPGAFALSLTVDDAGNAAVLTGDALRTDDTHLQAAIRPAGARRFAAAEVVAAPSQGLGATVAFDRNDGQVLAAWAEPVPIGPQAGSGIHVAVHQLP